MKNKKALRIGKEIIKMFHRNSAGPMSFSYEKRIKNNDYYNDDYDHWESISDLSPGTRILFNGEIWVLLDQQLVGCPDRIWIANIETGQTNHLNISKKVEVLS